MHNFVIKLNPETKEELYSDASDTFMGFLLIEAIQAILVAGKPGCLDALENLCSGEEDSTNQYDISIEYLLDINQKLNEECGIFLSEEEYGFNSEAHDLIANKLTEAIVSIEDFNDPGTLYILESVFKDPNIVTGFRFNALHFPDRVVFCILPGNTPVLTQQVNLASLITDYETVDGKSVMETLTSGVDPSLLSFQNELFNQRS